MITGKKITQKQINIKSQKDFQGTKITDQIIDKKHNQLVDTLICQNKQQGNQTVPINLQTKEKINIEIQKKIDIKKQSKKGNSKKKKVKDQSTIKEKKKIKNKDNEVEKIQSKQNEQLEEIQNDFVIDLEGIQIEEERIGSPKPIQYDLQKGEKDNQEEIPNELGVNMDLFLLSEEEIMRKDYFMI